MKQIILASDVDTTRGLQHDAGGLFVGIDTATLEYDSAGKLKVKSSGSAPTVQWVTPTSTNVILDVQSAYFFVVTNAANRVIYLSNAPSGYGEVKVELHNLGDGPSTIYAGTPAGYSAVQWEYASTPPTLNGRNFFTFFTTGGIGSWVGRIDALAVGG